MQTYSMLVLSYKIYYMSEIMLKQITVLHTNIKWTRREKEGEAVCRNLIKNKQLVVMVLVVRFIYFQSDWCLKKHWGPKGTNVALRKYCMWPICELSAVSNPKKHSVIRWTITLALCLRINEIQSLKVFLDKAGML